MACKCYHADKNFLGKIGVCWGTKECEACSCGGDESKCDFYEDKRKKATPKTTNADRIRAMSDEELADYAYKALGNYCCPPGREHATRTCIIDMKEDCDNCWLDWLRQEAEA